MTDNHFAYLLKFDSPGYYRFDLSAASVTHVANGGLGISAARKPNGAVTMLQNLNAVLTSDPVTGKVAGNLGSVPGNRYLTLSGDGNTVLGTSEDRVLAISPDGSNLYASSLSFMASMTCRVSLPAYVVSPCVNRGSSSAQSRPMAVSADNTKLYQPTSDGGVVELDTQALALLRVVSGSLAPQHDLNVVYSAAADSVYVATPNGADSQIVRVDLNTFQVAATQSLTFPPFDLAVTPGGTEVLVVGGPSGTTVLDGTTLAITGTLKTGVTQSIVIAAQ